VTDAFGPTVAKRRLSRRLAELRIKNGYTANQVCDKLNWGRGKVGRFEANAWKRPEMSDVRDLLRIYEVSPAEREELEDLAMVARARRWWREYGDVFGDSEYPGFEEDAVRICVYMPLILPGLLQTPPYMKAQAAVGMRPTEWVERELQARLRRQELLTRTDGTSPKLVAVITEASLLYRWGTQEQRREQIEYLVDGAHRPGVELRLLRLADGPHPGMSSLISIFDFPRDEPAMVYLENDAGIREVSTGSEVEPFATLFGRIRDAALGEPATTAYLKHLAVRLE
jgi:transcriptional regulator with XRE-family HTH domain